MPNRNTYDHIGNFNFRVEIDGVAAGYFKNVEGLDSETEVTKAGVKWGSITLKKGYTTTVDPFSHKVNPGSVTQKVNPASAMHKVNPGPAMHKVNPGPAMQMKAAGQLVLHGFVLDENNRRLLQHWVDPGAPRTATPRGQIVMIDQLGRPVQRWQFYEAWPCKWYVPEIDSDSGSDSSSSVELAVGKLIRM